jgi:hypothetical protein
VIERERRAARNRLRIPIEIHQHFASHPGLAKDGKIDKARTEVEHSRGMERPLIALAEDVGGEFLRRSIVIAEEIALDAIGIDGIDLRPWRSDPELTFRQIDRLHASFERKPQGAEAMLKVDAVAIKFAGSARRDDEVGAQQMTASPSGLAAVRSAAWKASRPVRRFGSSSAVKIFAPTQRLRTATSRRADSSASTLRLKLDGRAPSAAPLPSTRALQR